MYSVFKIMEYLCPCRKFRKIYECFDIIMLSVVALFLVLIKYKMYQHFSALFHRVIKNDCRGFKNLSYTINLR
jgi:hypothetical protein